MANKDKLLENAQKFLAKGQIPKAISEYQKLVQAFPKDVRNRQKLAELLSRNKRSDEALTEYDAVARHYTDAGFYLKAIAVFKQMQKLDPSRVDIYHRLAELNEKQGLVGNAMTEYRNLVSFYDKKEMHHEAIDVLKKMVELDPDNLNVQAKIAEYFMLTGRNDEALEKFLDIIDALSAGGEQAKIIKLYERFVDICPADGLARLPLASALVKTGSAEKAISLLKGLLRHAPEDGAINQCLAEAYVAHQDFENACLTLKHLLKRDGDDLDLREYFIRVCLDFGEGTQARERLEEWRDLFLDAGRGVVLKNFYEELRPLLADDASIAEALVELEQVADGGECRAAVVAEAAAESPAEVAVENGEAVARDARFESPEPEADKPKAVGIELDLDLEMPPADGAATEEETAEPIAEEPNAETPAEETVEVEMEIDLDGLDDLELEFSEDVETSDSHAPSMDSAAPPEPISGSEYEAASLAEEDGDTGESAEPERERPEPLSEAVESAEVQSSEDLEELEVPEALAEFDVAEEQGEIEELEELEAFETIETLDELEDAATIEVLEGLEIVDAIETVAPGDEGVLPDPAVSADALKISADLEEAEYYLHQGLYDDAARIVDTLLEDHPDLPELQAKRAEIRLERQGATEEPEVVDFVDLMADIQDDDLFSATDLLGTFGTDNDVDEDLAQKTVSELDSEDTESHFNLGIAYKEMGLYDDAVAEFGKASLDPARAVDCLLLTGQCQVEAGAMEAAMETFRSGLAEPHLSDELRMTLNYELGMLYQQRGMLLEALESFQLVAEKDPFFRSVSELIKTLRRELGLDDSDEGPQGDRDRVSYV